MRVLLSLFLVCCGVTVLAIPATQADCIDGCSNIGLDVGQFVNPQLIINPSSCTACGSGTTYVYTIMRLDSCGGDPTVDVGTFCSTSGAGSGNYEVQSIGAGCSGTPQGCVRLCPCT